MFRCRVKITFHVKTGISNPNGQTINQTISQTNHVNGSKDRKPIMFFNGYGYVVSRHRMDSKTTKKSRRNRHHSKISGNVSFTRYVLRNYTQLKPVRNDGIDSTNHEYAGFKKRTVKFCKGFLLPSDGFRSHTAVMSVTVRNKMEFTPTTVMDQNR